MRFLLRAIPNLVHMVARKGVMHWVRLITLLIVGYYLGHWLSAQDWLTGLRYSLYQKQLSLSQRGDFYPRRTALVLIDDDDYWSDVFQARKPLKRDVLATLIDRLNQAGANTVVLDIDFRSPHPDDKTFDFPDYRAEDAAFIAALHRMCDNGRHVALSASVRFAPIETKTDPREPRKFEELPSFFSDALPALPCVTRGYIQVPDDMRQIPGTIPLAGGGHLDSLALAVTKIADPVAYDSLVEQQGESFRFGRFLTEKQFAPRHGHRFIFSSREIREANLVDLRPQLADHILLVSGHWHDRARGNGPLVDLLDSPGGMLPGVMLHANYIEAMLDRTGTFVPISEHTAEGLEWLLVLALGLLGAFELHKAVLWSAFVMSLLFSIVLSYVLLQNLGLFLDFFIPLLMIVLHTVVEELLHMRHQLHLARHLLKEHH